MRKRTFKEAFPPQWLVGVDRLRCKWLNLKSATLMFFKSTQGRKGNLLIPITAPLRLLPVTESVALPPEARWNAMTDYPAAIPMFAIQQLRCPKCRARMKLARTSPGPTGFELKRFDCSECDHVEQIAIPSDDPMKSDAVGWFLGELQPPK